jgi:hypothetical protein
MHMQICKLAFGQASIIVMLCIESPPIIAFVAHNPRRQQKEWIDDILRVTGWTLTELARRSKVNQSTLTRFYNDPQDKATLRANTVESISAASGWDAGTAPSTETRKTVAIIGDAEILPPGYSTARGDIEAAIKALVHGRNSAFPRLVKTRALETAGYLPGDICIIDQNVKWMRGDVVIATIDPSRRGTRPETVLRIFEPPYLVTATYDDRLRKPIYVDGEETVILGTVVALFRPRLIGHAA